MSDDTTIHDVGDSIHAVSPDAVTSRRRAPLIVAAVALVLAGLFVVLIGAKTDEADTADSPLLGRPAPAVQTTTLDGQPFDLQRRKGSWVVLNGGSWPILADDDARIEVAFGVAKVPETWIIDPNGFVVSRHLGGTTDEQLTRLLAQAKAG